MGGGLDEPRRAATCRDVPQYLAFYGTDFKPAKGSVADWTASRRRLVARMGALSVTLHNVRTRALTHRRVQTSFDQDYVWGDFSGTMRTTLVWDRVGTAWKIVAESNR